MIPRPPISTLFPYTTLFRSVITRRTAFELAQAEARAHILEGLKIALDNLDEMIALIRRSEEHTSELQSHHDLVCRLLLEKKNSDFRQDGMHLPQDFPHPLSR